MKFLSDNIRQDLDFEDIFESIIFDIKALGDLEEENFNGGEYSLINPAIMLVQSNLKMKISSVSFMFLLQKQSYEKNQGEELNTLEVTIKSTSESNKDLYLAKVAIKNILKKYFKEIFILTDTQNEELCSQLYRDIHITENSFREAINTLV